MSNLLTPADRQVILKLYHSRRRLVRSLVLGAALVVALVLTGVSWLWIHSERLALETGGDDEPAAAVSPSAAAALTNFNTRLNRLTPVVTASSSAAAAWALALELRPAGVTLDRLEYSWVKSKPTLALAGVAAEREGLLRFIESLKASSAVAVVESPISNLVKVRDLPFELTLTLR